MNDNLFDFVEDEKDDSLYRVIPNSHNVQFFDFDKDDIEIDKSMFTNLQINCIVLNMLHNHRFKEVGMELSIPEIENMSQYDCYIYIISYMKLFNIKMLKTPILKDRPYER